MLSNIDRAVMQSDQFASFTDFCSIKYSLKTNDGQGGRITTLVVRKARVPCRLAVPSARDRAFGSNGGDITLGEITHTVTMSHNVEVNPGDTLGIGTRTFKVVSALRGGLSGTATRVGCVEF